MSKTPIREGTENRGIIVTSRVTLEAVRDIKIHTVKKTRRRVHIREKASLMLAL